MQVGEAVQVRFTKWGGGRHWEFDGEYLGSDDVGHWVGGRPPTLMTRPGRTVTWNQHFVGLFPHDGWFAPTFYERPDEYTQFEVYVDITTVADWQRTDSGLVVTLVDLDLDVFRRWDGTIVVDDEDEFAQHRVELGYPSEIISAAESSCAAVAAAVKDRVEPFGEVGRAWLGRLMQVDT